MGTSNGGRVATEDEAKAKRDVLLKVYDAAIAEYRFNVQLVWDRTKFFLLLSSGLVGAGIGLTKIPETAPSTPFFLGCFFILSMLITISGLETLAVGKRYYRESVFTKTVVERELGLLNPVHGLADPRANLSIAVTDGQRDLQSILFGGPTAERPKGGMISPRTVVWSIQAIYWVMIAIEFLGAINAGLQGTRWLEY
jgi:hypothetical protein